jgi:DNA segregation ATPase FtsK/SpoIIIE-like protein
MDRLIVALWLCGPARELPPVLTDPSTTVLAWLRTEIARRRLVMSLYGASTWSEFTATANAGRTPDPRVALAMTMPRLTVVLSRFPAVWDKASADDRLALDTIARRGRSAGIYLTATFAA